MSKRVPLLGDQVPRRGTWLGRNIARGCLWLGRWRVEGEMPNLPKFVVIVAPHNTAWDFPLAMAAVFALGMEYHWMGKHTLFRWPYNHFFGWFGGFPVDRRAPQGTVGQVVDQINKHSQFILGLAPEGTRRHKEPTEWKTGFYHIAQQAEVPIVPIINDYKKKSLRIQPAFYPTGNLEADLAEIRRPFLLN